MSDLLNDPSNPDSWYLQELPVNALAEVDGERWRRGVDGVWAPEALEVGA